jgi:hypothetical protein
MWATVRNNSIAASVERHIQSDALSGVPDRVHSVPLEWLWPALPVALKLLQVSHGNDQGQTYLP